MPLLKFIRRIFSGPPAASLARAWIEEEISSARVSENAQLLKTALSHTSGYVREAALKRAAETTWPEVLPGIIVRINDWVPQVRAAARDAFRGYIKAGQFNAIIAALPELFALRGCRRENHAAFVDEVEAWLRGNMNAADLPGRVPGAEPKLARALFDFCQRMQLANSKELIRFGLRSRDVVTKRKAVRQITQLPANERQPFIDSLLKSRSGWQRLEGLRLLDDAAAKEAGRKHLLDAYTPLREWCERRSGLTPDDLKRLRRDALKNKTLSAAQTAVAIRLCGAAKDLGSEADIRPYLDDDRAICRAAALLALSRLAPEKYESEIRGALPDSSGHVGRAAVQAALEMGLAVSPEQYAAYAVRVDKWPAAKRLLSFAAARNKWDHLGLALEFHARKKITDETADEFPLWVTNFNRSATNATPAQLAWIRKNLSLYTGQRPSAKEIEFYLR